MSLTTNFHPPTSILLRLVADNPSKLTSFEMDAGGFALSPNGKQFAFIASIGRPVKSYQQPDLWVMDIAPNAPNPKPRNLTAEFDYDVGGGLTGDNTAPRGGGGNPPVWTADGRSSLASIRKRAGQTSQLLTRQMASLPISLAAIRR